MSATPFFTESAAHAHDTMAPPEGLPPRLDLLRAMLLRTKRHGAPIRNVFVQLPGSGNRTSRGSVLAKFGRGTYLDAFLLIHALASAKEPYEVTYPAGTWARALGLDENTGSDDEDLSTGKTQWSKIVRKLQDLNLIERKRAGNHVSWQLLDESGDGTAFVRPKKTADGHWFSLPEGYWLQGHNRELSLPAKIMLLIALSSKPDFALPLERVKDWYGVSRSTAQRGFKELEEVGILTHETEWRLDPDNPRMWSEERHYALLGPYAPETIRAAMSSRRVGRNALPPLPAEPAPDRPRTSVLESSSAATPRRRKSKREGGEK